MSAYPQLDASAAQRWVYPASDGHPVREYQLNICKHALFMNTLVCLPTGLGKTLIAAVVMYNYYRWFPRGKVIFLAPTKPLVTQQINACHGIMGISEEDIAHLEGTVSVTKRAQYWTSRRVFFCTPQTLSNDLENGRCDARSIVCLVVDEAHRATGQYAYTKVVEEIVQISKRFRVLALSATPGSDVKRLQAVINNLLIAHIEMRAEDDPELVPYTHQRQIDIVVCPQGTYSGIQTVRRHLNALMDFSLQKLIASGMVQCANPHDVNYLMVKDAEGAVAEAWNSSDLNVYQLQELSAAVDELGVVLRCRKALCDEGMKSLLELLKSRHSYYQDAVRRGDLDPRHSVVSSDAFQQTLDLVTRACADPKYLERRQPKLNKLREILTDHFGRHGRVGSSTRALVFTELRSTVHEIKTELADVPGVIAHDFVGQGVAKSASTYNEADPEYSNRGQSQAEQARILRAFNEGQYNVLVATSIAEEGLDIAEVDLIILFEAVSSATRLAQRCGRTGRKRSGRVVMLVAQGTEEERVERSHESASAIAKTLRHASKSVHFYAHDWELFPPTMPRPELTLRDMEVAAFRPEEIAGGIGQLAKSASSSSLRSSTTRSDEGTTARVRTSAPAPPHQVVANPFLAFDCPVTGVAGQARTRGGLLSGSGDEADDGDWLDARRPSQTVTHNCYSSSAYRGGISSAAAGRPSGSSKAVDFSLTEDDIFGWGFSEPSRAASDVFAQSTLLERPAAPGTSTVRNRPLQTLRHCDRQIRIPSTSRSSPIDGITANDWGGVEFLCDTAVPSKPSVPSDEPRQPPQRELIELPDTPVASPRISRAGAAAVALYPRAVANLQSVCDSSVAKASPSVQAAGAPRRDGFQPALLPLPTPVSRRSALVPLRLRNEVQSAFAVLPFCCIDDSSSDDDPIDDIVPNGTIGQSSAALQANQADRNSGSEIEQWGREVTILDSDLKPRKRPPVRRILETPSSEAKSVSVDCGHKSNQDTGARRAASHLERASMNRHEDASGDEADSGTVCSSATASVAGEDDSVVLEHTQETAVEDVHVSDDEWQDTANACCACLDWECSADDPIVFCDGLCGSCVHVSCYGLLRNGVPEGDFYCESCAAMRSSTSRRSAADTKPSCVLCYQAGGLMKRSMCGKWTHPVCVLFTPELTIDEATTRPDNLADLVADRADLQCQLCRRAGGACVQCCVGDCLAAFHPYCAYTARQQMVVRVDPTTERGTYELYCKKHYHVACTGNTDDIESSRNPIIRKDDKTSSSRRQENQQHRTLEVSSGKRTPKRATSLHGARETTAASHARRLRRIQSASDTPALQLVSSKGSSKQPAGAAEREKRPGKGALKLSSKQRRREMKKYLDLEAAVSGSESSESSESEGSDDGSCISGDFINDGAYTQQNTPSGAATQYGMYLAVNNYHMHMRSPDDVVGGKFNIAGLVRGPRKVHFSSPEDSSVSILDDTPPVPRYHHQNKHGHRLESSVRTDGGRMDTASEGSGSSEDGGSAEDDGEAEFCTQMDTAKNKGTKRKAPNAGVGNKLGHGAVGRRPGVAQAVKVVPLVERLKQRQNAMGAELSSEDSDCDADVGSGVQASDKRQIALQSARSSSASMAQTAFKGGSTGSGEQPFKRVKASETRLRRPPLAPLSSNTLPQNDRDTGFNARVAGAEGPARAVTAGTKPAVAAGDEIFSWDF